MLDFRYAEDEEAFRKEVQGLLEELLPSDWLGADHNMWDQDESKEFYQFGLEIRRRLAARGWLGISWPKEYGGQGAPIMKQMILEEELYYRGVPGYDLQTFGVAGPLILQFGTDEQKKRLIPSIARGEVRWAIGISEPNAGSDFAAIQLSAIEGDCFVLNGQKIWQSAAHLADWCMVYARTDHDIPKHRGISCFLVDLKSPGVTMRPLRHLTGYRAFSQTSYDNVRVPKENILGEKNGGWKVATASFAFDRFCGLRYILDAKRELELLVQYCRETYINGQPMGKETSVRNRLAEMAIEIEVAHNLAHRLNWMVAREMPVTAGVCQLKVLGGNVFRHLADLGMRIVGLYAQLDEESKWAKLRGKMKHDYLTGVGVTIGAGTSEISKNTIATIGLGLPRG